MHMQFAYVFVLLFVDPPLQDENNLGKTSQYCTLHVELFTTPLPPPPTLKKITIKQTKQNKNWREKTNIDLA